MYNMDIMLDSLGLKNDNRMVWQYVRAPITFCTEVLLSMLIFDYLKVVRNPYVIFTEKNHPTELDNLYKIFKELQNDFENGFFKSFRLILTQSPPPFTTEFIKSDTNYIVLELQELNRISHFMEYIYFRNVNNTAPISYFHALWIESQEKYEQLLDFDLNKPSGDLTTLSVLVTDEFTRSYHSPLFQKALECDLLKPICNLEGIKNIFEIIPVFAIAHEVYHYKFKNVSPKKLNIFFDQLRDLSITHRGLGHFREITSCPPEMDDTPHIDEELYCDYFAIAFVWRLCVYRHWIDARIFCLSLLLMYNSFFFNLMLGGCTSICRYYELEIRKGYGMMWALDLDRELNVKPWFKDFEKYLGLFDSYCKVSCINLALSNMSHTQSRIRKELVSVLNELPPYNINGYASADLVKNPTIDNFISELTVHATRSMRDTTII